jgi:hypothetical protein
VEGTWREEAGLVGALILPVRLQGHTEEAESAGLTKTPWF